MNKTFGTWLKDVRVILVDARKAPGGESPPPSGLYLLVDCNNMLLKTADGRYLAVK